VIDWALLILEDHLDHVVMAVYQLWRLDEILFDAALEALRLGE
jgi:hypothetical protein